MANIFDWNSLWCVSTLRTQITLFQIWFFLVNFFNMPIEPIRPCKRLVTKFTFMLLICKFFYQMLTFFFGFEKILANITKMPVLNMLLQILWVDKVGTIFTHATLWMDDFFQPTWIIKKNLIYLNTMAGKPHFCPNIVRPFSWKRSVIEHTNLNKRLWLVIILNGIE